MTTTAKDPMAAVPSQAFARVVFVDCETNGTGTELLDFGAADTAGDVLHSTNPQSVRGFIGDARFLCGHNVFALDKRFTTALTGLVPGGHAWIDTLALSVLLFPQKRFHTLLKDEKLLTGEMNNPATDALKARDLFFEELTAWQKLAPAVRFCPVTFATGGFSRTPVKHRPRTQRRTLPVRSGRPSLTPSAPTRTSRFSLKLSPPISVSCSRFWRRVTLPNCSLFGPSKRFRPRKTS